MTPKETPPLPATPPAPQIIPPTDSTLRTWEAQLQYIDRTLERVLSNPTNGHIPIWAREDRTTIKRICNQIEAVIANRATLDAERIAATARVDRLAEAVEAMTYAEGAPSDLSAESLLGAEGFDWCKTRVLRLLRAALAGAPEENR